MQKEGHQMQHPTPHNMPSRKEALDKFFSAWNSNAVKESISLNDALGRVTAESITSRVTLPLKRVAGLDGIAVKSEMFKDGVPDASSWKEGEEYVFADTGDDFPDEYDAIVMVEWIDILSEGGILLHPREQIVSGSFTRPAGSTIREGDLLIEAGRTLRPTDLAALAIGGVTEVPVWKKPVISFLPTGTELIEPGEEVVRGVNIDTNSLMVPAMLREMGAEVITYPVMKDDKVKLEEEMNDALVKSDIVIINGGSSKGTEDFNITLLKEKGEIVVHNVAAVPGRPVALAVIDGKAVIDMPGPTLAAYFVADWCMRAIIAHYLHTEPIEKAKVTGTLKNPMPKGGPVEIIHRVHLTKTEEETVEIEVLPRKAPSSLVMSSEAQYVTSLFEEEHPAGSKLTVEII